MHDARRGATQKAGGMRLATQRGKMSAHSLSAHFPTFRRLRGRLAGEVGFPRWHIRATVLGVGVIVSLGAAFLALEAHESTVQERRTDRKSVV